MKTCSIILLLALWASHAHGRPGEATNEIHARYGEPAGQDVFLGWPAESYNFQEYNVLVVFKDGRNFIEALKPLKISGRIEVNDAETLAGRIANCSQWTRSETAATNSVNFKGTNRTVALLRRGVRPPDSLVVYSREAIGGMRASSRTDAEAQEEALRLQQQQAINGTVSAQCALGKRHLAGNGVPKDERLGRYWIKKAAAKGDADAKAVLKKLDGK